MILLKYRGNCCASVYNAFSGKKKEHVLLAIEFLAFPSGLKQGTYCRVPSIGTRKAIDGRWHCTKCVDLRKARGNANPGF